MALKVDRDRMKNSLSHTYIYIILFICVRVYVTFGGYVSTKGVSREIHNSLCLFRLSLSYLRLFPLCLDTYLTIFVFLFLLLSLFFSFFSSHLSSIFLAHTFSLFHTHTSTHTLVTIKRSAFLPLCFFLPSPRRPRLCS